MWRLLILMMSVLFLVGGCASMDELTKEVVSARMAGKEGDMRVYPVKENQAWDLARAVCCWEKTDEIEEHRDKGYLIVSTGMKNVAFGSVMGVWIKPVDSDHTSLTVVCRRRVETDGFTRLTAATFYERLDQAVKIMKEGKKLPVAAPEK